jgi:hypothetical protein
MEVVTMCTDRVAKPTDKTIMVSRWAYPVVLVHQMREWNAMR